MDSRDIEEQLQKATAHLSPVDSRGYWRHRGSSRGGGIDEYRQRAVVELDEPIVSAQVRRLRLEAAGETP